MANEGKNYCDQCKKFNPVGCACKRMAEELHGVTTHVPVDPLHLEVMANLWEKRNEPSAKLSVSMDLTVFELFAIVSLNQDYGLQLLGNDFFMHMAEKFAGALNNVKGSDEPAE